MKRTLLSVIVLVASLAPAALAGVTKEDAVKKAEAVLQALQAGKTAEVVKDFDATMTKALPEAQLKTVWPGLEAQAGKFKSIDERRAGEVQGMMVAELICTFENAKLLERVAYDKEGKISGLYFKPAAEALLPAAK